MGCTTTGTKQRRAEKYANMFLLFRSQRTGHKRNNELDSTTAICQALYTHTHTLTPLGEVHRRCSRQPIVVVVNIVEKAIPTTKNLIHGFWVALAVPGYVTCDSSTCEEPNSMELATHAHETQKKDANDKCWMHST